MKRLNRKKILTAFEELRDGLTQAHMRSAEHGDRVLRSCMEAHHANANRMIMELGGERTELPNLKPLMEDAKLKGGSQSNDDNDHEENTKEVAE